MRISDWSSDVCSSDLRTLRINYRTSHQIRAQADRLLGPEVSDVDGNLEDRRGTVSAFNGPAPQISVFPSPDTQSSAVGSWLLERKSEGFQPQEMGVFVRSEAELDRAISAVTISGTAFKVLERTANATPGNGKA